MIEVSRTVVVAGILGVGDAGLSVGGGEHIADLIHRLGPGVVGGELQAAAELLLQAGLKRVVVG